jgi:hypothetical protein
LSESLREELVDAEQNFKLEKVISIAGTLLMLSAMLLRWQGGFPFLFDIDQNIYTIFCCL